MNQNICLNCGNVCTHTGARNRCPACGAVMTNIIPPEEQKVLAHAFALLGESRFDEAKKEFESIIRKFPDCAEASWGRLRSRYHIAYALNEDGKALPVCPTVSGKNITEDIDYRKTLECADHVQQAYFQSQAEYIKAVSLEIKISKTALSDFALSQIDINDATPMPQPKKKSKTLPIVLTAFCLIAVIVGVWVGLSSGSASMIGCAHEIFFTPRIEPTCTEKGYTEGESCAICGEIFMEPQPIEPIGHKPNGAPTCLGPSYCELCFMELESASGHEPGTEATCTEPQTCLYCGYELEAAWGHDPGHEATCTEAQFCKRCNEELEPAIGHSYNSEITDPTCTEGGYTAYICHCGDSYTANMTPARGHQPGANATCTEASYCAYCGELMQPENGHMPGAEATCTTPQFCLICYAEVSPATGHDYQTSVTPPTCTESGYTTHTCHCGETYNDNPEAPTGHSPSGKTLCTDTSFCTVCREELEPATEHTVTEWIVDRELTESVSGIRHGICAVCNEPVQIEYEYSQDLFYEENENGSYTVYRGSCTDSLLIIPAVHNGRTVTEIGASAFYNRTEITTVIIPDTVTVIGTDAFLYCSSLERVDLSANLKEIRASAFGGTSLREITIPNGVTVIGDSAFNSCEALQSVTIPDSVSTLGSTSFAHCTGLSFVIIGNGISKLEWATFSNCTNLTEVTIGSKVTEIGESAFAYCTSLTAISIPSNVQTIGPSAFTECNLLRMLELHEGLHTIDEFAFGYCPGLQLLVIPDSVRYIRKNAFFSCTGLISVTVGKNVSSIGYDAFNHSPKLLEVINRSALPIVAGKTSNGCIAYNAKYVHNAESKIINEHGYLFCYYDSSYKLVGYAGEEVSIVLPEHCQGESYSSIAQHAFHGRTDITSVYIPTNITYIDEFAFSGCTDLSTITFGGTVEQWSAVGTDFYWNENVPATKVVCSDGEVTFD